jgi:hypothetical protein
MTIAEAIYLLCAATSLLAAFLLLRQYRGSRTPLLLWSVVAFAGLAVNNVLVYVDLVLVPGTTDLSAPRAVAGAGAMLALLYGLIQETR